MVIKLNDALRSAYRYYPHRLDYMKSVLIDQNKEEMEDYEMIIRIQDNYLSKNNEIIELLEEILELLEEKYNN